jgi:hypothetical protein
MRRRLDPGGVFLCSLVSATTQFRRKHGAQHESYAPFRSILLKLLAIPAGFEPATHGVEIRYSIQLSYGTVRRHLDRRSYHGQYEKSALPPSPLRTIFADPATKQGGRSFLRSALSQSRTARRLRVRQRLVRAMLHATFAVLFHGLESVTFHAFLVDTRRLFAQGVPS